MGKPNNMSELEKLILAVLEANETVDKSPPYRAVPIGSKEWLSLKSERITRLIKGRKNVCDSNCDYSKDGKCNLDYLPVMLWTRDHKELSEVICDSYIVTPQ